MEGHWVQVKGDPLPVPVLARIDRAPDGRFLVTGIVIGFHNRREVTWETLRTIKPATILNLIFSGFDPRNPAQLYADTDPAPAELVTDPAFDARAWIEDEKDFESDPVIDPAKPEYQRHMRAMTALRLWQLTHGPEVAAEIQAATRPRASVATDLREFADTYKRHVAINARRATTATAAELHISRATAIRRIAECRDIGLIPPKGQKS